MDEVLSIFYFFLPAGMANMAPVIFRRLPFLGSPVDFGKSLAGKRIAGDHKTWRGLVAGIAMAILFVFLQKWVYPIFQECSLVDYSQVNAWLLGLALGGGAMLGDLIESTIKRQVGIAPGKPWVPFDQLDWIAGALIASAAYVRPDLQTAIIALLLFGILHPVTNLLSFAVRAQKNPL